MSDTAIDTAAVKRLLDRRTPGEFEQGQLYGWLVDTIAEVEGQRARVAELEAERGAYQLTSEEAGELADEALRALAGLAGERLGPCVDTCAGHMQDKTRELYVDGLAKYAALEASDE